MKNIKIFVKYKDNIKKGKSKIKNNVLNVSS